MCDRKEINRVYDESLLHDGDFDERIFLSDSATRELGTPAVGATLSTVSWDESASASRNLFEEVLVFVIYVKVRYVAQLQG